MNINKFIKDNSITEFVGLFLVGCGFISAFYYFFDKSAEQNNYVDAQRQKCEQQSYCDNNLTPHYYWRDDLCKCETLARPK